MLSANRVDFGLFCFINFPILSPPPLVDDMVLLETAGEDKLSITAVVIPAGVLVIVTVLAVLLVGKTA